MKSLRVLLFLFALPLLNVAQTRDFPLTNQGVIELAGIRIHYSEIARVICTAPTFSFNLTPSDTDQLSRAGVSDDTIKLMAMRQHGLPCTPGPNPHGERYGPRETLILPDATAVRLRLVGNLTSGDAKAGDRIRFEVLDDVLARNAVGSFLVVQREAPALGTITAVNPTRLMGHYGRVEVAIDHVMLANGDKIAIRRTERGDRHTRPGLLVFLLAPIGLVVQPKDPVWLTPEGNESVLKDGVDFKVWTDGVADLDGSEFEQR